MLQTSYAGFGAAPSPMLVRLQRALVLLGIVTHDSQLRVATDGITGPGTAKAVNHALLAYLKTAPAQYRTGKLTPAQIAAAAGTLAALVEAEAHRRGGAPAGKAPAGKVPAGKAPAGKITVTAKKPPPTKPVPSKAIAALQTAVRALGLRFKDSAVSAVARDGIIGPKTIAATNRALVKYAPTAPAHYRTGKLTGTEILIMAPGLTAILTAAKGPPSRAIPAARGPSPAAAKLQSMSLVRKSVV